MLLHIIQCQELNCEHMIIGMKRFPCDHINMVIRIILYHTTIRFISQHCCMFIIPTIWRIKIYFAIQIFIFYSEVHISVIKTSTDRSNLNWISWHAQFWCIFLLLSMWKRRLLTNFDLFLILHILFWKNSFQSGFKINFKKVS